MHQLIIATANELTHKLETIRSERIKAEAILAEEMKSKKLVAKQQEIDKEFSVLEQAALELSIEWIPDHSLAGVFMPIPYRGKTIKAMLNPGLNIKLGDVSDVFLTELKQTSPPLFTYDPAGDSTLIGIEIEIKDIQLTRFEKLALILRNWLHVDNTIAHYNIDKFDLLRTKFAVTNQEEFTCFRFCVTSETLRVDLASRSWQIFVDDYQAVVAPEPALIDDAILYFLHLLAPDTNFNITRL